jgi:2,3-bisphosphoglycerate-dependent phosphoglycerate mutase
VPNLVLLRHGQSLWNKEGRFTGWTDIDLSERGIEEAKEAGLLLVNKGCSFDVAYTSYLKRAIRTLWIVLDEMDLMWVPIIPSWRLNERCYGELQGRSKRDVEKVHGSEQVHRWRRGYRDRSPDLKDDDMRYPGHDSRYEMLKDDEIPRSESLKDTLERVLPFWQGKIEPDLRRGKRVLISAHGNTLRALAKHIEGISDEDIEEVEIPTGIPLIYHREENNLGRRRYRLVD